MWFMNAPKEVWYGGCAAFFLFKKQTSASFDNRQQEAQGLSTGTSINVGVALKIKILRWLNGHFVFGPSHF